MMHFEIDRRRKEILTALLFLVVFLQGAMLFAGDPNLGEQPQFNQTVQGQSADQVEGTVVNVVNYVGNVICPLAAGLCIVMAVIAYMHGRGMIRWAIGAAGMLSISALTHLLEALILKAHGV